MKKENIVVSQKEGEEELPAVIMAQAIVDISEAMKKIADGPLKRKTIVTLIRARSKVANRDIELVMDNLQALAEIWLK